MKKKNITMKVLMETMKKLNQEGYEDIGLVRVDPKTGKRLPPMKNFSLKFPDPEGGHLSKKDLQRIQKAGDVDDKLDLTTFHGSEDDAAAARLRGDGDDTKKMRKVAEIDFGGPGDETTTMVYNDDDTIPDAASTTEMVDALSDQVIAQLEDAGALPLDLSNEEAKDKVEDALMNVLKDMDATDWHKQDRGL
tara:strand:- start:1218 stop:1793 length:576 start_codon:yes stop_codon:yes gene_type:complete